MSFNWPEIPFTGAEVEAFVNAYKELAESIYDDYVNFRVTPHLIKAPYQNKEDVKELLTRGLLYAAFIVKQRSGNIGPGTDFVIGNSPNRITLTPGDRRKIIQSLGCINDDEQMRDSFKENSGKNGGFPGYDPDDGSPDDNLPPYIRDLIDWLSSKNDVGFGCSDFIQKYQELETTYSETIPGNSCLDLGLTDWFVNFFSPILKNRFTYLSALAYLFVYRYMSGVGGVLNRGILSLYIPLSDIWLREDVAKALNTVQPEVLNLPQSHRDGYGMLPQHNAYLVSTKNFPGLKNLLGDFTVITDGTEQLFTVPNFAPFIEKGTFTDQTKIIQIRDDYDFDYGYEIQRDRNSGDMPGNSFTNSQIRSGPLWDDANSTPCDAASKTPSGGNPNEPSARTGKTDKWEPLDLGGYFRYIIARNHGIGRVEVNNYVEAPCRGKPFAVHLDYR